MYSAEISRSNPSCISVYYRPIRIDVRSVRGKHKSLKRFGCNQSVIAKSHYKVCEVGRDT